MEYFNFIYKIEYFQYIYIYKRLNLKMLVYIGLYGNFQLKQQLKITHLQIFPNRL